MQDLDRLLNPEKRFLEYQDYLIDLIASSYHKSFKDLIATRIKDAFYFFDSTPDVTYQFVKKFNPNIKNLIKYYFLSKDYEITLQTANKFVNKKRYYPYIKDFFNINISYFERNKDKILNLNLDSLSKESEDLLLDPNISEVSKNKIRDKRQEYLDNCKSIGLNPIVDINKVQNYLDYKEKIEEQKKYLITCCSNFGKKVIRRLEHTNNSFLISIEEIATTMLFLDAFSQVRTIKTNQNNWKSILIFPLLKAPFSNVLDEALIHELIHVSENCYNKYCIFNEIRTEEKAFKLFSKLREDNIYIYDYEENNNKEIPQCIYEVFIPLIEPLLDTYRELIDYCAITNELSPIYENLGYDNFDTYCKLLDKIFKQYKLILKFKNEDEIIDISSLCLDEYVDKMKTYSKRKNIK